MNEVGSANNLKPLSNSYKINLISTVIIIGFTLAVFYHYILGSYFGKSFPLNTFLFTPTDRFMDFFNQVNIAKNLNPYYETNGWEAVYFPFSYVILYTFSLLKPSVSFILFNLIFIIYFALHNYNNLNIPNGIDDKNGADKIRNFLAFSFLTYPFLFVIDRGNIESFLFIFLSLFAYFYLKKDFTKSILFLSGAIAMKLVPCVFIILFVKDKKYKEVIYILLISIILTAGSLLLFKGDFMSNITGNLDGLSYHKTMYAVKNGGIAYGSSIWSILKYFVIPLSKITSISIPVVLGIYTALSGVVFILLSLYIIFIEKEHWKTFVLLTFSLLLLPYMSGDYRLLLIFIPLFMFIKSSKISGNDFFYTILFALLLIPKGYLYIKYKASVAIILNPLIMILMSTTIIREGLRNRETLKLNP